MSERWYYLEPDPAVDAPISDNPSGLYCPLCRLWWWHCSAPEWCGEIRRMRKKAWRRVGVDPIAGSCGGEMAKGDIVVRVYF